MVVQVATFKRHNNFYWGAVRHACMTAVARFSLFSTFAGWANPWPAFSRVALLQNLKCGEPPRPSLSIAALTSQRTNLSPFTKGCRDWGAPMRLKQFLPGTPVPCDRTSLRYPLQNSLFGAARSGTQCILAEGAIVRSMTLCGGVLVAS